jgi:hypothetical protein
LINVYLSPLEYTSSNGPLPKQHAYRIPPRENISVLEVIEEFVSI